MERIHLKQNATPCDIQALEGKNPAHSPRDFSFYSYFSSDCHKNESVMQSVTITGNSLILFQTLKLLDFLQVMRNFNGEQDNKIKTFYCFCL